MVNPGVRCGVRREVCGRGPERGVRVRVIDAFRERPGVDASVQKLEVGRARVAVSGTFDNT